jgi:cellulose synthase/poly-beta-1,6-N-acetylglucosamine synthase-like glycosyltransferase
MKLWYWGKVGLRWLEIKAGWLQLLGLLAVGLWQLRLWRRDRRRLTAIQAMKPFDLPPDAPTPLVSILLPAWNESDHIEACLQAVLALRYPNKQLIICAGGSDDTLARAQQYANSDIIVLEQQPGEGKQRALRRCYAQAAGEIVFLTDADCLLDDVCFERTLAPLLVQGEAATTGTWQPFVRQTDQPLVRYQWSHHVYRELWLADYPSSLDGRNAAVRRNILEDVGGFVLDTPIGTDYLLSRQLEAGGYQIRLARGSQIQTEYPQTITAYWRQLSRWFRNPLILGWQWADWPLVVAVLWSGLTSLLLILMLPLWILTRSKIGRTAWLTALVHLWITGGRLVYLLYMAEQERRTLGDYLWPLLYLPMGWLAMVRGLHDAVSSQKRKQW